MPQTNGSITYKEILTVEDLYEVLKAEIDEIVQNIESSHPTTQNNYGRYMGAIAMVVVMLPGLIQH